MLSYKEEIFFWSGILRDHGEFIITGLTIREQESIKTAMGFKNLFMELRQHAEELNETAESVNEIVNQSIIAVSSFINFKRSLLRRMLECKLECSLPPTFINHMINEALEYCRVLSILQAGFVINKSRELIHLHNMWLPDASGHAATLRDQLDPVESVLIKESEAFKMSFDELSIKARELGEMLERAQLCDGLLEEFSREAGKKMKEFICFLEKIFLEKQACRIMAVFKPLIPNHMIREGKYYLSKLEAINMNS